MLETRMKAGQRFESKVEAVDKLSRLALQLYAITSNTGGYMKKHEGFFYIYLSINQSINRNRVSLSFPGWPHICNPLVPAS